MDKVRTSIDVFPEHLEMIERAAKKEFMSRNALINKAAYNYAKKILEIKEK